MPSSRIVPRYNNSEPSIYAFSSSSDSDSWSGTSSSDDEERVPESPEVPKSPQRDTVLTRLKEQLSANLNNYCTYKLNEYRINALGRNVKNVTEKMINTAYEAAQCYVKFFELMTLPYRDKTKYEAIKGSPLIEEIEKQFTCAVSSTINNNMPEAKDMYRNKRYGYVNGHIIFCKQSQERMAKQMKAEYEQSIRGHLIDNNNMSQLPVGCLMDGNPNGLFDFFLKYPRVAEYIKKDITKIENAANELLAENTGQQDLNKTNNYSRYSK